MNTFLARILLLVIISILGGMQPALARIEVTIDRNPVQVNESFQLVFSVDRSPDLEPDFSGLQQNFMLLGSNRTNNISIINGEYQRSVKWTLQLMPKQIGEHTIPAIRFDKERSKSFKVTVEPSSLASVPHAQLVLELVVDKAEVYVQSQVILTMRLLSATNISDYQFGKLATEDLDLVIEPLGDDRQYQTRIADKSYLVIEKQFALFPQQSGRLAIAPGIAEVRLPPGSKFDPFRTGGEIRRVRSQRVFVDVAPIPAEFTGSHWLPADKLELHEAWQGDLNRLVAGEPITRNLTIVVDGLTAAQLPALKLPLVDGLKQYPDQPGLETTRSKQGIRGKHVQKVALIPGAAGSYQLPEINLPWWNRQTGKMETATIPARELIVNPAISASEAQPVSTTGSTPPVIAANRFWLWLSLFLACGWIATMLVWWIRSRRANRVNAATPGQPGLRAASRQLQQACANDDAGSARRALLAWGGALLVSYEIDNLHQLGRLLGADLEHQIEALNRSLYAGPRAQWQGRKLWRLCRQLQQNHDGVKIDAGAELLPLNPAS